MKKHILTTRGGVEDTRLEAKDTKIFRGQEQTLSRPRTQAQVFSKKNFSKNFFKQSQKKDLQKIFFRRFSLEENKKRSSQIFCEVLALSNNISTIQKIVLSSSRGQGNFRGLEASRPRTSSRTPPLLTTAQ